MKIQKKEKSVKVIKKLKTVLKHEKIKKKVPKMKSEKTMKSKMKKTKEFGKMDLDEFMEENSDQSDEELSGIESINEEHDLKKNGNESDDEKSDSEIENVDEFQSHKQSLNKLKDIDPEFYKFLQENDKKLLNFNISDSEAEDDDEEEESQVHKPTEELEVASDEDDFEAEDALEGDPRNITLQTIRKWQSDIHTDKSAKTINCIAKAFNAALIRVSNDENACGDYRIDGSSVFNAVIQLCVMEMGPALRRYLRLPSGSKQQLHKCKKFPKIKTLLRGYFLDLLKLLGGVTSSNIQNVLLKHLHGMSIFLVPYSNITKKMLKRLIHLWGTAEESVRVIAFLCILRITNNQQAIYLDFVLKSMYMTYVKNSKFMGVTTLAEINFMRRSLVEIYALDVNVSYQHVFLYVRQLAIQLRSAVTLHKKEHIQAVYNWQFVNSLHLWAALLTATCNKSQLQPLIYPLVQVAIGVIKLVPTAQYYPLRFHCLEILIELSKDTGIFIPVLPLLLEVLSFDFNKKHKKVSMKPLQFTCLLRLSKSQMMENGFKDTIIDTVYGLLLEYLASQSHTLSFPDTTLMCTTQIRQFIKKCSVANYNKKLRLILEKIDQTNQLILKERKNINLNIKDLKQIEAFEMNIKNNGTPLLTFYESWKKLHMQKKQKEITQNDVLGDFNLPVLRKGQKPRDVKRQEGPVELFPSDSEDEMEVEDEEKPKRKRGKRGSKKQKVFEEVSKEIDDDRADEVTDIKVSDW